MTDILIVEDDRGLNQGIALGLGNEHFRFTQCSTLSEARAAAAQKDFSLVILDLNLPDGSGYEFLKEYRYKANTPILVLTANDLEVNEVMGFELGANDYVTKPFSLAVLRARVKNLLRLHHQSIPSSGTVYNRDGLYFDPSSVHFEKNGAELLLSRTEQKLLLILLENQGMTVPRERLLEKIWPGPAEFVDSNALSVAVSRLRAKIEDDPSHPEHILNVYGIGYVWK